MCGRFTMHHKTEDLAERFRIKKVLFPLQENFNVAPTQQVALVRSGESEVRELVPARWGLIPHYAKHQEKPPRLINARAEGLLASRVFRPSLIQRRCLIPGDGFFEWAPAKAGQPKQPWYFSLGGDLFGLAGLWEEWLDAAGKPVLTCTIITTTPNSLVQPLHNRMPVMLRPEDEARWLDPELQDPKELVQLLQPYPADLMTAFPVSTTVNSTRSNSPECIVPLDSSG